jgi:hypothetical protein
MANPYPKSLSEAIAASRNNIGTVDTVGTSQSEYTPVISTMEKVAGDFIEAIKTNLTTGNYQVTGDIANITIDVVSDTKLNIVVPVQLLVMNYGIAGVYSNAKAPKSPFSYHMGILPPLLPFLEWQKFRKLEYRRPDNMSQEVYDGLTDDEKDNLVAYAIKTSIYKEGRKPIDIFTTELNQLEENLIDALGDQTITNIFLQLPVTIGVPAAYNAEGKIPLTGVPYPGLLQSNR